MTMELENLQPLLTPEPEINGPPGDQLWIPLEKSFTVKPAETKPSFIVVRAFDI